MSVAGHRTKDSEEVDVAEKKPAFKKWLRIRNVASTESLVQVTKMLGGCPRGDRLCFFELHALVDLQRT